MCPPGGRIQTPVNQKRLTNVAIVRLRQHGKHFECACYPNKVREWQQGIEGDLNEVLHVPTVFSSVKRGVLANEREMEAAFGSSQHTEVCMQILRRGELQVSKEERNEASRTLFRAIAAQVAANCVHSTTGGALTLAMVESALGSTTFLPNPRRPANLQLKQAIWHLQREAEIPLARRKIRIAASNAPQDGARDLADLAHAHGWEVIANPGEDGASSSFQIVVEPSEVSRVERKLREKGFRVAIVGNV